MSVFCYCVKGMLRSKVTDNSYMCRRASVLQFSWNSTMLQSVYTCEHFVCERVCKHDVHVISTNKWWVYEQFIANHLQTVFSMNTKDVCTSVGTVFVCRFKSQGRGRVLWVRKVVRSWFATFSWFAGSLWKNKFYKRVCKHNVCKCIRSIAHYSYVTLSQIALVTWCSL